MKSLIKVVGSLRTRVYENDVLIQDHTSENMVVNQGLQALVKFLAASDPAFAKEITKGQSGTSNTAPAGTDVAITAPLTKNITATSHPTPTSVRFDWTITTAEQNGVTIQEYGLTNPDGVLYARIVKPPIVKSAAMRIENEWTITLSAI